MDAAALLIEIQSLKEVMAGLRAEFDRTVGGLQQENKLLRQKIAALLKRFFGGPRSEALDAAQLELLLAGLTAEALPAPVAPVRPKPVTRERQPAVRQKLPAHLETERIVMDPSEVQAAPDQWRKIGEEVTEELDWTPAKFIRREYVRPKYARVVTANPASAAVTAAVREIYGEEPAVVIAPLRPRLIEKGLPGAGLLAQLVIAKYEDHLPLYRQARIFRERHGVDLARQSLCDWVEAVAGWLRPIYEAMKRALLAGGYLQVDETPMRYLDPDVPGQCETGFLWAFSRPRAEVVFDWHASRGREGPRDFLGSFKGDLQSDGYGVYPSLAKEHPGEWTLYGCWAHARRKFHEGVAADRRAAWMVRQIGHLYAIEKQLREQRAGPALRTAVRAAQALPVLERIKKAMARLRPKVLPKSQLGEAISYATNQWDSLVRYVTAGRVEIDNNLVENAIRPAALGRKNFLFIGHPDAGWRSAVIYSVLGSCRRLGINSHEYLQDVLRRLPSMKITEIASVTPAGWAKEKKAAAKKTGA